MQLQPRFSSDKANSIAWLALMVATGIAWWFGRAVQSGHDNINSEVIVIILAAAVKVWIVGFQFMEIKTAPNALKYGFTIWLMGISLVLAVISTTP